MKVKPNNPKLTAFAPLARKEWPDVFWGSNSAALRLHTKFGYGDRVRNISGSLSHGFVRGVYSTMLTPEGYCVESDREPGSVQLYPAAALEKFDG